MTSRQLLTRFALMTCTAFGVWTIAAVPARADINVPTDAPRSPLFGGATPFSQKLIMFEELGLKALPARYASDTLPVPADCNNSPGGSALDTFLGQPLSPAPREEANTRGGNPWLDKINACLGFNPKLMNSPIEGRPPGEFFAHQRYYEFYPEKYFQTATAGARVNTGLRNGEQRHHYNAETEFGPDGLYYAAARGERGDDCRNQRSPPPQIPDPECEFGLDVRRHLAAQAAHGALWRTDPVPPLQRAADRPTANRGFGAHELSTHFHNGH